VQDCQTLFTFVQEASTMHTKFNTKTFNMPVTAHSTPDPDLPPATEPVPPTPVPPAVPVPDDVPAPAHAPVTEPGMPEQPMRAANATAFAVTA
jgi:hypothetical protein